jgi:hypothetical protein
LHTKEHWRAVEYIKDDDWDTEKRVLQMQKQFFQLACCYALSDMLQATPFQNAIIDHLVRQSLEIHKMQLEETIGGILNDMILAWHQTPSGWQQQHFMIHQITKYGHVHQYKQLAPYQSASLSAHARFLHRPHEICC